MPSDAWPEKTASSERKPGSEMNDCRPSDLGDFFQRAYSSKSEQSGSSLPCIIKDILFFVVTCIIHQRFINQCIVILLNKYCKHKPYYQYYDSYYYLQFNTTSNEDLLGQALSLRDMQGSVGVGCYCAVSAYSSIT